jgi:hypothetical protein
VNQVAAVVAMTIIVEKVVAEISLVAMAIGLCMCCVRVPCLCLLAEQVVYGVIIDEVSSVVSNVSVL